MCSMQGNQGSEGDTAAPVQAGAGFQLSLRVQNRTHHLQELALCLGDTSGFVLAGGDASPANLGSW